jgi:murein DD-endopeptidase MepM/ murein hydrolase activator NlpD
MRAAVSLLVVTVLQGTVHADEFEARLSALSHVFDDVRIDLGVSELGEHFVRWQKSLRDFLGDTAERLAQLSEGANIPDVSILSVEPVEASEASGFGWRDDPIRHSAKFHSGTDFKGKSGTPVLASGPGVVVFAGRRGGYGNLIEIDHGGGVLTRYAHLRKIEAKVDETVLAGERIGQVGSTGRTTGPHLHFEVRLDDSPVDPLTAFAVAQVMRDAPDMGRLAAFALSPEVQGEVASKVDPPHGGKHSTKKESRPERHGHVKQIKPVS